MAQAETAPPEELVVESQSDDNRPWFRGKVETELEAQEPTVQVQSISGVVLNEGRAVCAEILATLRQKRVSVVIAFAGWGALIVLSAVPDAICVSSVEGAEARQCLYGESYWTLSVLLGALLLMANEAAPDLVMLGFTVLLVLSSTISDAEAWSGFSSTSVLSIGALFVVARALEETRAVERMLLPLLGQPSNHISALFRLCIPVALFSAFLNNTPIVAMLLPVSEKWAVRSNLSIKVLLMPLSFASMLGGMCTLIGTSTNLVLNAQIEADAQAPLSPLSMFSMSIVALPAAAVGMLYLSLVSPLVFRAKQQQASAPDPKSSTQKPQPGIQPGLGSRGSPRYTLECQVDPMCELLIGKDPLSFGELVAPSCTVRLLARGDELYPIGAGNDHPDLLIEPGDLLIIACLASSIEALQNVPGLQLRPNAPETLLTPRQRFKSELVLVEAVVAVDSPLVKKKAFKALKLPAFHGAEVWSVRQRAGYHTKQLTAWAAMPIHTPRSGMLLPPLPDEDDWLAAEEAPGCQRTSQRNAALRDATEYWKSHGLRAGDSLLVQAPDSWVQAQKMGDAFAVLNRVTQHAPSADSVVAALDEFKFRASIVALLALLVLSASSLVSLLPLAISLAYILISIGCISLGQAWRSISYRLIITIACSFGPGAALTNTNISAVIGAALVKLQPLGDFGFLLCIYLITSGLSCLVSNSATVVAFYSVLRAIKVDSLSPEQLMLTMMLGASSAFMTPIGYQTNLMVVGRGGYAFGEFMLLGGGLTIIVGTCVAALCLVVV